jgi:phosphomannomutase
MNYYEFFAEYIANSALQGFAREGKTIIERPMKIVCDPSNGAAGPALKELVKRLPNVNFIFINDKPDPDFPGHGPNPTLPGALEELSKTVIKNKADFGVAFDSDGDRAIFMDEKGKVLYSYLTAVFLFRHSNPPFVADELVYESLRCLGVFPEGSVKPSRVGAMFVKEQMKKNGAERGVEESGHIFFREMYGIDSGELATISMLSLLSRELKPLSDLIDNLPRFYTERKNDVSIVGKNWKDMKERIRANFALKKDVTISERDGITIEHEKSWVNARPSNTEPILRIYSGAPTKEEAEKLIADIAAFV